MERIREIVERVASKVTYYEVAFRPRWDSSPENIVSVYDSQVDEVAPGLRKDIDLMELKADDYEVIGEEQYNCIFPGYSDFTELYGDSEAEVLVIWLEKSSYELLSNPEICMLEA